MKTKAKKRAISGSLLTGECVKYHKGRGRYLGFLLGPILHEFKRLNIPTNYREENCAMIPSIHTADDTKFVMLPGRGKMHLIKTTTGQKREVRTAFQKMFGMPKPERHIPEKGKKKNGKKKNGKKTRHYMPRVGYVKTSGHSPYDVMEMVPEQAKPNTNTLLNAVVRCNGQDVQEVFGAIQDKRQLEGINETSQMIRDEAERQFAEYQMADDEADKVAYEERAARRAQKSESQAYESAKLDARQSQKGRVQQRKSMYHIGKNTKSSRPKRMHAFTAEIAKTPA